MHAPAAFFHFPFASAIEPWMLITVFVVFFLGALILVPWVVVTLPADYFARDKRQHPAWASYHPVLLGLFLVSKNLLGLLLFLIGVTMLVLPGQGLLTMLIGILLLDYPGKFQSERWLVKRKPIRRAVNWLRKLRHKPPFDLN